MKTPAFVLAVLAVAVSGCGAGSADKPPLPGKGKPPVTMATKNFTEQYVLGQLYTQALRAKGFTVVLKENVGSSEIVDRALADGVIDTYPEYIGVIAQELARAKNRPHTRAETYARAKAYEGSRGFAILRPTPGFDADANAVRPDLARKYNLRSTADLKRLGRFTYGGPPENQTRFQGAVGMRQVYGLNKLVYVPLTIDQRYPALDRGRIDVAAVFTTEGQLTQKDKYVLLTDPKGIFGYQNIVPVVSRKVLHEQGPAFAAVLNAVSAKLTNEALQGMNAAVALRKQKPAAVARAFLLRNRLVEPD